MIAKTFKAFLKKRARDAHKGLFGHVLIIGGDQGFGGAVRLAGEAALRVGAGLVSVATHPAHAAFLNMTRPEIMSHGVHNAKELAALSQAATVIVAGPGLGLSAWSKALFRWILQNKKPMVLDADALNLLAKKPCHATHWILTPHPGEAARLLNTTSVAIQENRLASILALQKKFGGVIVLKGAKTLVKGPKAKPLLTTAGNPGMATAGMGDVLTGVIGGLLAQQLPPVVAAELGVLIHAKAGDLAAKAGERGLIASDLFPYLRQEVNL